MVFGRMRAMSGAMMASTTISPRRNVPAMALESERRRRRIWPVKVMRRSPMADLKFCRVGFKCFHCVSLAYINQE